MRFLHVAGLGIAITVWAGMAAGAQAAPELGRCVNAPKAGTLYTGHYVDKTCNTKASAQEISSGGKANKYEWEAGPGATDSMYTIKGKGGQITTRRFPVTCKKTVGKGQILGTLTVETKFTFAGCGLGHKTEECHSSGAGAGEIETGNLLGTIVENAGKEILIEYEPKPGEEPWLKFECAPKDRPKVEVEGLVAAKSTGLTNVSSKKGLIEASETVGEQFLIAEYLTLSREPEEELAVITLTQSLKFETKYEIRTFES